MVKIVDLIGNEEDNGNEIEEIIEANIIGFSNEILNIVN